MCKFEKRIIPYARKPVAQHLRSAQVNIAHISTASSRTPKTSHTFSLAFSPFLFTETGSCSMYCFVVT
jgi:hypothetical protein